jgi:hypothetical protein
MPPKAKTVSDQFTATIGFEATALRGSANPQRAAILRSPQGNRWLITADTAMRDSAMPPRETILRSLSEAKDNLRNPTFSAA